MQSRGGLKEIERKAWLRTFEHGMWDIAIGLLLLSFGLSILTELYWLSAILVPVFVPALGGLARRIVVPRIGHATFRGRRSRSLKSVQLILFALVLGGGAMFAFTSFSTRQEAPEWAAWVRSHFIVVIGLIWGGALAVAGWAVVLPRLYAYGAFLFVGLLATDLSSTGYHLGHALIGVGGLIVLVGAALFVRFIQRYPPHRESADGKTDG